MLQWTRTRVRDHRNLDRIGATSAVPMFVRAADGIKKQTSRRKPMSSSKDAVRKVLDAVKADKRTSLTAPEGKLVCDAYGIPVPKEGVAKSAAEAAKLAADMGFPVVMKIVSPDILHKTEAGGVVVGVKTAADAEKNYDDHSRQRQEVQGRRQDRRHPGAADADGRPGGHRRRHHRRIVRQAGGLRPRRRAGRGVEGHHLPPRARDQGRRAVDARRHPGP